jgi:hypothetical protein
MGRNYTGYIALHSTFGSKDVDCCLIPENHSIWREKGDYLSFWRIGWYRMGTLCLLLQRGLEKN